MERIKAQADKLTKIVTDPQTYGTYKETVVLTWNILREAGLLLWLGVCLFLVVFEWFWNTATGAGRNTRAWFDSLEGSSEQIASETGKVLLSAGKNSLDLTIETARKQLGLPAESAKELEK